MRRNNFRIRINEGGDICEFITLNSGNFEGQGSLIIIRSPRIAMILQGR